MGRNGDTVFRGVDRKPTIPKHIRWHGHGNEIRMDELQGLRELDVVGWLSVGVLMSRNNTNTHCIALRTTTNLSISYVYNFIFYK